MNIWLRRNRWYLVAIAVLAPLAMLAAMSTDWFRYEEHVNGRPILVAEGDKVDFAGAEWSLDNSFVVPSESQEGRSADLPENTELVVASVLINPSGVGDVSPSCTVHLKDRDGRRTWDTALDSDVSVTLDDGASAYCDSTRLDSYLLQVLFLVPTGAGEGSRLIIESNDEAPALLSIAL
ncbi:MAG: hypothetical protein ACOH19_04115 [Rhodoglobus sp.]